jgi:hypothetical protein
VKQQVLEQRIKELEAILPTAARYREALEPFAKAYVDQDWFDGTALAVNDSGLVETGCTVGDLRRAAAILASGLQTTTQETNDV